MLRLYFAITFYVPPFTCSKHYAVQYLSISYCTAVVKTGLYSRRARRDFVSVDRTYSKKQTNHCSMSSPPCNPYHSIHSSGLWGGRDRRFPFTGRSLKRRKRKKRRALSSPGSYLLIFSPHKIVFAVCDPNFLLRFEKKEGRAFDSHNTHASKRERSSKQATKSCRAMVISRARKTRWACAFFSIPCLVFIQAKR